MFKPAKSIFLKSLPIFWYLNEGEIDGYYPLTTDGYIDIDVFNEPLNVLLINHV